MPDFLSPDQVLAENIAAMGEELGQLYTSLSNELTWAYWSWGEFVELYASKPSRVRLVNRAAPLFFHVVQESLWDTALLGIARLAGPLRTRGKENLSVLRLEPWFIESGLRAIGDKLFAEVRTHCAFALEWRNRRLAHRDLALALRRPAARLPAASKDRVDAALRSLAHVLNALDDHFCGAECAYELRSSGGGAVALLQVIRDGLRLEEHRIARARAGSYDPAEWGDGDPPL